LYLSGFAVGWIKR